MTLQPNQNLDHMLEAMVVVAWDDMLPPGQLGRVHVQYRFGDDHSLANLQVWASEIRGHWMLVCEYSGVPSSRRELHLAFSNSYRSDLLTQILGFVVENQSKFARGPELNRDSLAQVETPTEDEKAQALKLVNEAQTADEWTKPAEFAAAS